MKDQHVLVTGMGVSGPPVVAALMERGARVTVVDDRDDETRRDRAAKLSEMGAVVHLGPSLSIGSLGDFDLVITSPGWQPNHPLLQQAAAMNVEVIGDVEFAWRLDQERSRIEGTDAPLWLGLTGTNGKTTTVGMLASITKAAGLRSAATGNVGYSIVSAVLHTPRYEVLAVELSSFQLHWTSTLTPKAGALINIAEDHLDWHGSFEQYRIAKEKLLRASQVAIVNLDDEHTARSVSQHAHRIGVTRDIPRAGEIGVVEDFLVDRAFADPAIELATFADISPFAPHNITNALIAAALARSIDIPAGAIAAGLRNYTSDGHRIETIATLDGVRFVNDSKATNPHAAEAALSAFDHVIWIAGGLAKGASMDDLVRRSAHRIKSALLIGHDREVIAQALRQHAPHVQIEMVEPTSGESSSTVMAACVQRAKEIAQPGDVVLLAPACASMDQFESYAERGELFAKAVNS